MIHPVIPEYGNYSCSGGDNSSHFSLLSSPMLERPLDSSISRWLLRRRKRRALHSSDIVESIAFQKRKSLFDAWVLIVVTSVVNTCGFICWESSFILASVITGTSEQKGNTNLSSSITQVHRNPSDWRGGSNRSRDATLKKRKDMEILSAECGHCLRTFSMHQHRDIGSAITYDTKLLKSARRMKEGNEAGRRMGAVHHQ